MAPRAMPKPIVPGDGHAWPLARARRMLTVPATRPLTSTIRSGSPSAMRRVRLLSSAQRKQASVTTAAPVAIAGSPGVQPSTIPPTAMTPAAIATRALRCSPKTMPARTTVKTTSRLRRSAVVVAELRSRPQSKRGGAGGGWSWARAGRAGRGGGGAPAGGGALGMGCGWGPPPADPPATPVRAPRGTELSCKGWPQEAALRMLMNNLDPDVAERWEDLIVYGGSGKAARSWEAYHTIVRTLRRLEGDETLLVQSGKPVGVFKTHPDAPRVLIANALLVPEWGDWEHFRRYEAMGLTMYGQMTAGSWIYIGTQGILQGTFETFGACARKHFGGSLAGRLVLSAGLGGMGGAQPLAVTLNGGVGLFVEVDRGRIERRLRLRYVDRMTASIDEALGWAEEARAKRTPLSIAVHGNAAEVHPELASRGVRFDVVTDQTSAHDMLNGYIPAW